MEFQEKVALLGWLRGANKARTYEDALNDIYIKNIAKRNKDLMYVLGGDMDGRKAVVDLFDALKKAPNEFKGIATQS